MKIILSRKGFDSANGGIVSPIMEDGTMVSMPIPIKNEKNSFSELFYNGISYDKILADLGYNKAKFGTACHLDPDLDQDRRMEKVDGWFPAFGQIDAAAGYLLGKDVDVQPGDIFLFFGNFHCVEEVSGRYRYIRKTGEFYKDNDLQIIWGYLQVGEIIRDSEEQRKIKWHPHSSEERTGIKHKNNVIFKASKILSFDESKCGAGLLKFDPKRVLTLNPSVGKVRKATWKSNDVYSVDNVVGNRRNSVNKDLASEGIYYAGIWQELCLKESEQCVAWAKEMIL